MFNKLSDFIGSIKTLATALIIFLFFFSSSVMAGEVNCVVPRVVDIQNGSFSVSVTPNVPTDFTVRSAIVQLPDGVTGTIDQIKITGPDSQVEFGCPQIKNVKNGTNLIQDCGGPAPLKAGKTTYQAKGSNFQPSDEIKFSIKLCDDFASSN